MKTLKTIDYRLGVADRKVRILNRLNPTNANKERRKFLYAHARGSTYNPFFRYKPLSINLKGVRNELQSMCIELPTSKDERWFFSKYLENKRRRIIKKIEAIEQRGEEGFTKQAKKLFGVPTKTQVSYAASYLRPENCKCFENLENNISSPKAASMLQIHLEKNALPWRVKLRKNISSKAGLDGRSNYLLLKKTERFSKEEVASLAVHEIETHIFRKENGLTQSLPYLFGQGFAGAPTTEEGLAFFNETQQPVHDPRRFLIVCARTLASHIACKKSFHETFSYLKKRGLPQDYSWSATLRAKRGLSDTSRPGALTKDQHYLKGYLSIKKYIKNGGSVKELYVGKINTATIKSMRGLGVKNKGPIYLPDYLR